MTALLSEVIKKAENLSVELQDEIATQLLTDIEGELAWQKTLSQPQIPLEHLAEQALQSSVQGKTKPMGFDEL